MGALTLSTRCSRCEDLLQGSLRLRCGITMQQVFKDTALFVEIGTRSHPGQQVDNHLIERDPFRLGLLHQILVQ